MSWWVFERQAAPGDDWVEMARPNPTSVLHLMLRHPGDEYTDGCGYLYRLRLENPVFVGSNGNNGNHP